MISRAETSSKTIARPSCFISVSYLYMYYAFFVFQRRLLPLPMLTYTFAAYIQLGALDFSYLNSPRGWILKQLIMHDATINWQMHGELTNWRWENGDRIQWETEYRMLKKKYLASISSNSHIVADKASGFTPFHSLTRFSFLFLSLIHRSIMAFPCLNIKINCGAYYYAE